MLPRTRDGLRVPLRAPPPRHAHPLLKIERAGELIRESSRSVFLCSLIEERTISSALRLKNC